MKASVKTHKKFSASQAERYLNCPGSIRLSEGVPSLPESAAAREGTDAHFCVETLLTEVIEKGRMNPATIKTLETKYKREMTSHAIDAVNEISRRVPKGAKVFCEQKVDDDLKYIDPDFGGTLDAAIVELFGRLEVIDYKYGAGIAVDAVDNPQLIAYALAIAKRYEFNFDEVKITVIQPRAFHESGNVIRTWDTTTDELLKWEAKFKKGLKACRDPKAPTSAGDWCRFCPAKHVCPSVSTDAMRDAQIDFKKDKGLLTVPAPEDLENSHLQIALSAADKLDHWITGVRSRAFEVLNAGGTLPGYKLVMKRASRVWVDPIKAADVALKKVGLDAFEPRKLKSPAQIEKLGAKKYAPFLEEFAASVSSGLTMVPESDPRPAATSAKTDFVKSPSLEGAKTVKTLSHKKHKPETKGLQNGKSRHK